MEKAMLNNQIVQCRPAIKRARVCIIRKKIKKLKILKTCKKEKEMDKKLKKSERLLEEILLLKKVKEDDVTKFALQSSNITEVLHKTPLNDHDHVYATLAIHPDVQKQLSKVKNTFPDQEKLLKLLQTLGTRSVLKKYKEKNKGISLKPVKIVKRVEEESDSDDSDDVDSHVQLPKIKKKVNKNIASELSDSGALEFISKTEKDNVKIETKKEESEQKVDDPFFVSKKVAIPKLILDEVKQNPKIEIKFSKPDKSFSRPNQFNKNSYPVYKKKNDANTFPEKKSDPPPAPVEEKLHPSWAAKKIKLIQPFQGKKIKFDD